MRAFVILIVTFNLFSVSFLAPAGAAEKRNQLEELMIWKFSDELKLTSLEEKKFSEILRSLNEEKAALNQSLQGAVEKMAKADTKKAKEDELNRYRKLLQSYARLGEQELDRLKPLLGIDRLAQYLALKQDIANKIKTLLSSDAGAGKALPPPKLIEEK